MHRGVARLRVRGAAARDIKGSCSHPTPSPSIHTPRPPTNLTCKKKSALIVAPPLEEHLLPAFVYTRPVPTSTARSQRHVPSSSDTGYTPQREREIAITSEHPPNRKRSPTKAIPHRRLSYVESKLAVLTRALETSAKKVTCARRQHPQLLLPARLRCLERSKRVCARVVTRVRAGVRAHAPHLMSINGGVVKALGAHEVRCAGILGHL